jgi:hypothetical protein
MVLNVPSAKKQADDAKRSAKLSLRIETNLKGRDARSKQTSNIGKAAS